MRVADLLLYLGSVDPDAEVVSPDGVPMWWRVVDGTVVLMPDEEAI